MATSKSAARKDAPAEKPAGNPPVDKFHDGPVHVSIWENKGPKGAFRTAAFQLRYRDDNKEWHTGYSYSTSDLQHLESAAREARSRIENWQKSNTTPAAQPSE